MTNARELIAALKADLPAGSRHRIALCRFHVPTQTIAGFRDFLVCVASQSHALSQNGGLFGCEQRPWNRVDSTLQIQLASLCVLEGGCCDCKAAVRMGNGKSYWYV